MKKEKEEKKPCANEGCTRPAEKGADCCETCALEWSLLRRDRLSARAVAARPAPRDFSYQS